MTKSLTNRKIAQLYHTIAEELYVSPLNDFKEQKKHIAAFKDRNIHTFYTTYKLVPRIKGLSSDTYQILETILKKGVTNAKTFIEGERLARIGMQELRERAWRKSTEPDLEDIPDEKSYFSF